MDKPVYAVVRYTFDAGQAVQVFLFSDLDEAVEWLENDWSDFYNRSLTDGLADEENCWHEEECAQVHWEDDYTIIWRITDIFERNMFLKETI